MAFPGVGRAALIAGSSGGTPGRTQDWSTYDGTEDTDWQQWVDDTSTALGSSYDVSYTENNSIGAGQNGYLAITNGSQEFLGYYTGDSADPTSIQITLNGGYSMERPEIRNWGASVLMTSTTDQGSLVLFKDSGTTDTGKISGMFSFQPTHTRHSVVAQYWYMPGITDTQYGNADQAYSLILMARNPDSDIYSLTNGTFTGTNQPVWTHKVIEDINDLYSTPSTALTSLERSGTNRITGKTYEGGYFPLYGYNNVGGNPDNDGSFYNGVQADGTAVNQSAESMPRILYTGDSNFQKMRHPSFPDNFPGPNNAVEWRGTFINWTPYHITDGSTTGGNQGGVMWNITFPQHIWNLRHPTNTNNQFALDRPYSGGVDAEYNDISVQNPDRIQYQGGTNRSETELGDDLVQAIELSSGVWVGLYGDGNGTKGGNLYVNSVARTDEDLDSNWTYRISPEYIVAEDITTPDTHASNSEAVSVVNGSDSSSTAFDPDTAHLFNIENGYFGVMWRKSTTAYLSIFSYAKQTSTPVALTREVDAFNLGTVPEGNISGTYINRGMALITCGNYYKIIKLARPS